MEVKRATNIIVDKSGITIDYKNMDMYERYCLGIWPKENITIKKEGNKMIESLQLINLYEEKQINKIEEECKEKVDKIREKLSLRDKLVDILTKAEEQLTELYFSQFTEEQKEAYSKGKVIDQSGFWLTRREQIRLMSDGSFDVNEMLENDETRELYTEMAKKRYELRERMKVVKAHVGIAKTKEEVEEILTNYGILKKGKLVD